MSVSARCSDSRTQFGAWQIAEPESYAYSMVLPLRSRTRASRHSSVASMEVARFATETEVEIGGVTLSLPGGSGNAKPQLENPVQTSPAGPAAAVIEAPSPLAAMPDAPPLRPMSARALAANTHAISTLTACILMYRRA